MGGSSADIQKKTKEKEKKEESLGRKKQFRLSCLVQLWTLDVLGLNWSAQLQDLCRGDTSSQGVMQTKV